MSATLVTPKTTSGGEIITHLINATDGEGLHFDGAGSIDFTPVDLGTAFSFEFITQADSWAASTYKYLIDIGLASDSAKRFTFGSDNSAASNLKVRYGTTWVDFGIAILDDLKVHHLCVTVDGTSAILYDNGNQVGTATIGSHSIDDCDVAGIASNYTNSGDFFNGTLYRTRFWNKTLTAPEVTASYENATVPFADQYGSQTIVIPGDFTGDLDGWDASNTWNSQTNPSNNMVLSASGASQYCRTNTTLEVGKKYRLTYTATNVSQTSYFGGKWTGGYTNLHTILDGTQTADFTYEFAAGFTDNYFYCYSGQSTSTVTLSNLSLVEIGCVADYDLAFANPTQSDQVQDRAGAADGTSSATGVSQITKLEQVNTNKLSVGGVLPKVGIGLLAANTPVSPLTISAPTLNPIGDLGSQDQYAIAIQGSDTSDAGRGIAFGGEGDTDVGAAIIAIDKGSSAAGDLAFYTKAISGSTTERMRIDSAGDVGVGCDPDGIAFRVEKSNIGNWGCLINNTHATDGYGLKVKAGDDENVKAFQVSDVDNNALLTITGDGLATFSNGIVETNGVLKENLLTNSGFDVWSNSTLENATGTNLATAATWTNFTSNPYDTLTVSGADITQADGPSATAYAISGVGGLTLGKLYKVVVTVTDLSGGSGQMPYFFQSHVYASMGTDFPGTRLSVGANTFIYEYTQDTYDRLGFQNTNPCDWSATVVWTEVTPGILAAGLSLGPDGWKKRYAGSGSGDVYREHDGSNTKDGSYYSLKYVSGASDASATDYALQWPVLEGDLFNVAKFTGRTVTFGCWIKQISTTGSVKIGFQDNGTNYQSSANTATDAWEWMEFTRTLTATTSFSAKVYVTEASKTVYISQPMLVFGSAIGAGNYSRPSGEIVNLENRLLIQNNLSPVAADDKILNLEVMSNGAIPKGCGGVHIYGRVTHSAVTSGDGLQWGPTLAEAPVLECLPVVNAMAQAANGFVTCDSNGDIYQYVTVTSGTLSGLFQSVYAIQLR